MSLLRPGVIEQQKPNPYLGVQVQIVNVRQCLFLAGGYLHGDADGLVYVTLQFLHHLTQ